MTTQDEDVVAANLSDPNRGRFDAGRAGQPNPADPETYPAITPEDHAATRMELDELRRRMTRKAS